MLDEVEPLLAVLVARPSYALADVSIPVVLARVQGLIGALTTFAAALARDAEDRGLPAHMGYRSTRTWLQEALFLSRSSARQITSLAEVRDKHPQTGSAVLSGQITPDQAITIGTTLSSLAPRVDASIVTKAEEALIDQAGAFGPDQLAILGDRILHHVAPEIADEEDRLELERAEQRAHIDRGLAFAHDRQLQRTRITGWLTAEQAAHVTAALEPLARPLPKLGGITVDERTAPQRRADALAEICRTHSCPHAPTSPSRHTSLRRNAAALNETLGRPNASSGLTISTSHASRASMAAEAGETLTADCAAETSDNTIIGADCQADGAREAGADISHHGRSHTTGTPEPPAVDRAAFDCAAVDHARRQTRNAIIGADCRVDHAGHVDSAIHGDCAAANGDQVFGASDAAGLENATEACPDTHAGLDDRAFARLRGTSGWQIAVTVDFDVLRRELSAGLLDTGQKLTPESVRRLACDAQILPAVLGGTGQILDLGRSQRTWTGAARRAILVRDRGCVFPHCDRPATACDIHHIEFWSRGGPTDLTNGALLCAFHHYLIHHSDWKLIIGADGVPEVIPPAWFDPLRRSRRNEYHRRR